MNEYLQQLGDAAAGKRRDAEMNPSEQALMRGRFPRFRPVKSAIDGILVSALLVGAAALPGCRIDDAVRGLGLTDRPAPPLVEIRILLDTSVGSECTPAALDQVLSVALPECADLPGSTVELWHLGENLGSTHLLGVQQSAALSSPGPRARLGLAARFVSFSREYLQKAAEPAFSSAPARRSPIAEGITRLALGRASPAVAQVIVLLSDGREVSALGDFECGPLPSAAEFVNKLQSMLVLPAGSLANTTIVFAYIPLGPVPGRECEMTLARARRIEELWRAALEAAGAASVRFFYGPLPAGAISGPSTREGGRG